jgi:hypothetical protein
MRLGNQSHYTVTSQTVHTLSQQTNMQLLVGTRAMQALLLKCVHAMLFTPLLLVHACDGRTARAVHCSDSATNALPSYM